MVANFQSVLFFYISIVSLNISNIDIWIPISLCLSIECDMKDFETTTKVNDKT